MSHPNAVSWGTTLDEAFSSGALTAHRPATASDVHPGGTQFGPDKAIDDDPETRWATSNGVKQAWLQVDLADLSTVSRLVIKELDPRLSSYQLQYRESADLNWRVAYEGSKAGTDFTARFSPVRARSVRLNILDSTRPPTIWEFQVFAPSHVASPGWRAPSATPAVPAGRYSLPTDP